MSLLDKINDSITESTNSNEDNTTLNEDLKTQLIEANKITVEKNKENEELKNKLNEANEINNRNIEEIRELKELIKNYNTQIDNLQNSYNETINNLKEQISFEKEINEKYLSNIAKTNNEINNNFNNLNDKSNENNKEILSLVNNNHEKLNDSTSKIINEFSNANNTTPETIQEINNIKEHISQNTDEVKNLISEIKNDNIDSNNKIVQEVSNQKTQISELKDSNNQLNQIELNIKDNVKQLTDIVAKNRENHNNTSSEIINKITNLNDNHNNSLNDIRDLFNSHQTKLDTATSKIINETSNQSSNITDEIVEKINKSIEANNKEILAKINNYEDKTKIEILNKISNDLRNNNYVNIDAYKKIKKLNLFDETFYKKTYDYNINIDPLLHFIYKGYEEDKKPNPDFNPVEYKESNINIEKSDLNPLVYFVTRGVNEGNIKINKDFSDITQINKYKIDKEIKEFTTRGVKKTKRKPRLIVSLTSVPEHMYDLHYTLYSLLNQQLKADKVILWLSKTDFPNEEIDVPKNVLSLKQNGLSIRFCDDLKSYNKIIPVITSYPNDIIITANDDVFYPNNWLKILYEDYKNNQDYIISQKSRKILLNDDNKIEGYDKWILNDDDTDISELNFPVSEGGVLYPPNSFHEDVTKSEIFTKICKDDDDLWLWTMSVLNNKKIKVAKNKLDNNLTYVNAARQTNLLNEKALSTDNKDNENFDDKINNIIKKYPELSDIIKE